MTFKGWLRKQIGRDDPVGDLAQDFVKAKKLPDRAGLDWKVAWALDDAEEEYRWLVESQKNAGKN